MAKRGRERERGFVAHKQLTPTQDKPRDVDIVSFSLTLFFFPRASSSGLRTTKAFDIVTKFFLNSYKAVAGSWPLNGFCRWLSRPHSHSSFIFYFTILVSQSTPSSFLLFSSLLKRFLPPFLNPFFLFLSPFCHTPLIPFKHKNRSQVLKRSFSFSLTHSFCLFSFLSFFSFSFLKPMTSFSFYIYLFVSLSLFLFLFIFLYFFRKELYFLR